MTTALQAVILTKRTYEPSRTVKGAWLKMQYISYCGLKCAECPVYLATCSNDMAMKKKLAQDYTTGSCVFTPKDMACRGCQSPEAQNSKMCGQCPIRICAQTKPVETCADCADYPCPIVEEYIPTGSENRILLDNLFQTID